MYIVYKVDNLFDVYLVKYVLEDVGILVFVFGEQLLGGMGELLLFGVLWVGIFDVVWLQVEDIVVVLDLGQVLFDFIFDVDDIVGFLVQECIMLGIGQGIFGIGVFKQCLFCLEEVLLGCDQLLLLYSNQYFVNSYLLKDCFVGLQQICFVLGCFWGVECKFWIELGVYSILVGYVGGIMLNLIYEEVCLGLIGYIEVVQVVFDLVVVSLEWLLQLFWESYDLIQGMCQGNDIGIQYCLVIYVIDEVQYKVVLVSCEVYQVQLVVVGYGLIIIEIVYLVLVYYYVEDYYQQYLVKNLNGYCGIGGIGVSCLIGLDVEVLC